MIEPTTPGGASAGRLLRQAREAQGLHIAALAAAIKVAPRKLDALENDRWSELPDATFTRALAQSVCRTLGVDPRPVLELLPAAPSSSLDRANRGINTPFRSRGARDEPGLAAAAIRPMVGAALVLMVAAVVVYFLPDEWMGSRAQRGAAAPAASAGTSVVAVVPAASDAAAPLPVTEPATSAASAASATPPLPVFSSAPVQPVPMPASAPAPAASLPPADGSAGHLLQLRTSQASWIEVRDARGQLLLSRVVQPGESLGFDPAPPLRLTVGNPAATEVAFRGRTVDLSAPARDKKVARIELP